MGEEDLVDLAIAAVVQDFDLAHRLREAMRKGIVEETRISIRMGISQQETRKMLYMLQDANLAHRVRVKETKDGTKHVYWRINYGAVRDFLRGRIEMVRRALLERSHLEENVEYYVCAADPSHYRAPFDEILMEFLGGEPPSCPVCGALLEPADRSRNLDKIRNLLSTLDRIEDALLGEQE